MPRLISHYPPHRRTSAAVANKVRRTIHRLLSANKRQHLRTVLGQATIARPDMTELPLDHAERMLDGGADRCLDVFDLFGLSAQRLILDRFDLAALGRDMPLPPTLGRCVFLGTRSAFRQGRAAEVCSRATHDFQPTHYP